MKQHLTVSEYQEIASRVRLMQELYWDIFRGMTGRFPKNGKTIRKLLRLDATITSLYYQMEYEFFQDYPEKELKDFGRKQ